MNRELMIQQLKQDTSWDVCIIGGGATGLGIAIDAASRGLRTALFEKYDFAKGTSSRSTKLVHGGVRYLQQGNIKLVFEALKERGLLLKNAPHLVHNQQFIVPNYKWWEKAFYGIGLKIYDKMAGKLGLGPSIFLSKEETLKRLPALDPEDLRGGILYHDGQFDDARLAISMARTAFKQGALILNYFSVNGIVKENRKIVGLSVRDELTNTEFQVRSKAVINATGVFTDQVMKMDDPLHEGIIRPSQGIHLVVDKEFLPGETAIMIPRTDDGRVLFAVPWHDKIVLGTTDTAIDQISEEPIPMEEEIDFVLTHIGRYLTHIPTRKDVRSMFAGLRPLIKNRSKRTAALSRDHLVTISDSGMITVTGGKWTTYRKMAEDAVDIVVEKNGLVAKPCCTRNLSLEDGNEKAMPAFTESMTDGELRLAVQQAVVDEMCCTVEDFLSRRTRQLLLDAEIAVNKATDVAKMMAEELGKDDVWIKEQINTFKKLALNYKPRPVKLPAS